MQGVARHLAAGFADHIARTTTPAPGAVRGQGPDAPLARTVAVHEVLVKNQPVTFAAAVDAHIEAFDHFPRAILEHAPGLHRHGEERDQVQRRLFTGVMVDLDIAATAQQQAADQ
ncbi:hypothetical protein D3C78_545180 [compost metagenome]